MLTVLTVLTVSGCAGGVAASMDEAQPDQPSAAGLAEPAEGSRESGAAQGETTLESSTGEVQPLITATPDAHSEVGELVEGFPVDLLPVPADAMILVTSAVPVGNADVQEVSLNLRTAMTAQALMEMYRTALLDAGFTEVPPAASQPDLAEDSVFTRSGGDELVSIGVLDLDDARTVTIGGRIRTPS